MGALKAVDKAIVMGSAMDGNLLKAAASAHHQAIGSIDASGVTSAADYASVTAALGRSIASTPTSKVTDVYNAFAGLVQPSVPNALFSKVDSLAANAAASAFYEFGNVVKATPPGFKRVCSMAWLQTVLRARRVGGPHALKVTGGFARALGVLFPFCLDSRRRWCIQRISACPLAAGRACPPFGGVENI